MNQRIMRSAAILSVAVMALAAFMAILPTADAAEQSYDIDLGKKYSLKTQLIWDGGNAESILYKFSDGTTSTEWNPIKTWDSPGVYYITQTATNSYNGGSSTTTVYKVEIMGYPEIFFEENGGSEVADIEQTAYGVVATQPADPTKEGCDFTGWYKDSQCTQKFDWSTKLTEDITLYAGWASNGSTPVDPETPSEDKKGFEIQPWMIILVAIAVIAVIGVLFLRG